MPYLVYREANKSDVTSLARVRAENQAYEEFWHERIRLYMDQKHHPQQALPKRILFIAEDGESPVGLIAGHLTRRLECDGELQWVDVIPEYRKRGIASSLLKHLADWFLEHHAKKICVNCVTDNSIAQKFYKSQGAQKYNDYWLVWKDISCVLNNPITPPHHS